MVLMSTDALTSRGFYITLGTSWIGDTAHLAACLSSRRTVGYYIIAFIAVIAVHCI